MHKIFNNMLTDEWHFQEKGGVFKKKEEKEEEGRKKKEGMAYVKRVPRWRTLLYH